MVSPCRLSSAKSGAVSPTPRPTGGDEVWEEVGVGVGVLVGVSTRNRVAVGSGILVGDGTAGRGSGVWVAVGTCSVHPIALTSRHAATSPSLSLCLTADLQVPMRQRKRDLFARLRGARQVASAGTITQNPALVNHLEERRPPGHRDRHVPIRRWLAAELRAKHHSRSRHSPRQTCREDDASHHGAGRPEHIRS